ASTSSGAGLCATLDYYGQCQPAGNDTDFLDFIALRPDRLLVAMGDVSGHGLGSAMVRSGLQMLLRQTMTDCRSDLARGVADLIRTVWGVAPDDRYATMFCAQIDPASAQLSYVNAGHEPALLIRKGGRVRRLESTGPVLGLSSRSIYRQRSIGL